MATDLGNLSLGIAIPGLAMLDALEARLAVMDRAQHTVTLGVSTGAVTQAEQSVASLGTAHQALGSKSVALGVDVSQVESARTSVKNLDNDLLSLVTTAGKVGPALAAGVAIGGLTKFAADYQTTMVTTANNTTLANDQIAILDKTVRSLPSGAAPLADLATGFKNITDLNYSAADAQKIATEESRAATESGANQATVMLAITSAMKEYNAQADEVGKYTNIIAEAARLGNTSMQAWTDGTRTGTAYAAAFGVSLQEADAFMVALTRHGFDASEASTQLRGVIQHIVADPKGAADQTIAEIKQATGIDLTPDFGPNALKTQGLTKIMQDLHDVTIKTGDEAFVNKLIPALRGGTGAIITITQAYNDSTQALDQLGQAATGAITPVEDGFNRISNTAGYKFGQTMKDLKFDAIDLGNTFLPIATDIIGAVDKIPAGAIKAAADIGLAFAAIKTASAIGGLVDSGIAKATGLFGGASATETAAQSAASDAATTSTAALTAALGENTAATVANTAAKAENGVTAAEMVANIPGFVLPLASETTAIEGETAAIDTQTAALDTATVSRKAFTATSLMSALAIGGALAYGAEQLDKQLTTWEAMDSLKQLQQQYEQSGMTPADALAQAQQQQQQMQAANGDASFFGIPNPNIPGIGRLLPTGLSVGGNRIGGTSYSNDQFQAQQAYIDWLKQQQAGQVGPPLPPGYSDPQTADSLPDKAARDQATADAKASATAQANYFKQLDADVAASRKQGAADVAAAWKQAETAVSSIDLSKGLDSLSSAATGLDTVRANLAALGQDTTALDGLSAIADQFKAISDAENTATEAYKGYLLTLDSTDKSVQAAEALKKRYDDAATAADAAIKAGTATDQQRQIAAGRTAFDANITAQISGLQQNGAGDLLAAVKVAPDFSGWDDKVRAQVAQQGGGPALMATVDADTTAAKAAIHTLEVTPWKTTITATVQYALPDGTPISASQIDNPGGASGTGTPPFYQPPLPASDPRSSANIDNPGGPGAIAGAVPLAAGGGGAMGGTIQYSDYQRVLAGYPGSPLNNPASFNALTSVAGQTGVDPRVLMAIMQTESGYGANAGLIGQQFNYGGMGVNDRGYGHDSGIHATDGGPEYEGYKDFQSFLMDISAWVKQNGSSFSTYQTLDQGQTKNATITQLDAQLPLGSGAGGAATGSVRDQIVAKAMQAVGTDTLVNYCEQFVEETVQAITGQRVTDPATGKNPANATRAFQVQQAQGLETQTPQKGDLVYYPSASGGDGHVAIYMGNGQQVSTYDARPTGVSGDQYAVHTEAVNPGARYISVGLPGDSAASGLPHGATYAASNQGQAASVAGGTTDLSDPNTAAAQAAIEQQKADARDLATSLANIDVAANKVNAAFAGMNPPDIKAAQAEFTSIESTLQKMALDKLPAGASDADKQIATNAAVGQGLEYEAAWANLVKDIESGTGNIAADQQRISDIIGGPMAANLTQQATATAQMAAANSQIVQLQKDATALDEAHAAVVRQRTAEDQAASRQKTRDSWAAQDAQNRLQDRQNAENVRYTQIQRDEQDKQRQLQFSQQVQATDLQNKLTDLQKQQQSTVYQRTAQEQVVAASAQGATTNAGAASQAAILAAMHNQDLAQKDLNTKAIDDIQLQIREQAKAANLESYNLQTETIAEQRKHENAMQGFTQEGTAMQRAAQQQQRDDQIAQWQLQDKRQIEDATYADAKDANAKAQDAQKQILIAAQASLDAANQALTVWQQTGAVIVAAATSAANLPSYINSTAQLTGVNTIRNLGGYAAGGNITSPLALVGEYGPEIIHAPGYGVIPAAKTAQLLSSAGGGSGTTVNITGDINVMAGDGDAWMAEARAKFEARLQEVKRELERKGITAKNRSGIR